MKRLRRRSIALVDILPPQLPRLLREGSRIALGLDLGTTTKEQSNPSALALTEQIGLDFFARLILRWKTQDPEVTRAIIRSLLLLIAPRRPRRLCVDATSEKFFAADLRKEFAGLVPVELVVASEATTYLAEKMNFKQFLGNLVVNTMEDATLALPDEEWIKRDFRQVKRDRGTFDAEVEADGSHADCFDAVKLSLYGLNVGGGPPEMHAAQVGTFGRRPGKGPWRNPHYQRFNKTPTLNA